jgi:hypothetical protein
LVCPSLSHGVMLIQNVFLVCLFQEELCSEMKRFLDNKGMGEILSFYHGQFYKTDGYHRWSECKGETGHRTETLYWTKATQTVIPLDLSCLYAIQSVN